MLVMHLKMTGLWPFNIRIEHSTVPYFVAMVSSVSNVVRHDCQLARQSVNADL